MYNICTPNLSQGILYYNCIDGEMNFITLYLLSVLSDALQNQNRSKEEISERLRYLV